AGGIVPNYVHNHVLRGMLTPATGASILNGILLGQSFGETYTKVLDSNWNAQNMDIVAFVSDVAGNNFPVLQASHVKIIP
ncbi:MAG: Omp28-related outer membrane protein, partial [Saprospiraceae bacterium]